MMATSLFAASSGALRAALDAARVPQERKPWTAPFAGVTAAHARAGGAPVAPGMWTRLLAEPGPEGPRALYLHVPFCRKRCLFCPFYRFGESGGAEERYAGLLAREIEAASRTVLYGARPFDAVYFGGGTPSGLPTGTLASLLRLIRRRLPLAADCEVTVEGRASDFTAGKVAACADAGASRISMGIQCFDTERRRALGRIQSREELLAGLRALADASRVTVILDLIYGLPGESEEDWSAELDTLLNETGVDGWDCYKLKTFPGSPLAQRISSGKLAAPASPEGMAARFRHLLERMDKAGTKRLSVWHWRRSERERSRYNRLAKSGAVVLPLGCGAGGKAGAFDLMHHAGLDAYAHAIEAGEAPVKHLTETRGPGRAHALVGAGAEAMHWSSAEIGAAAGARAGEAVEEVLAGWERAGLVERDGEGGGYALLPEGQFWNVELQQRLSAVVSAAAESGGGAV